MIITKLNGGLGNQLFQYAAGRATAKRLHTSLYIDTSDLFLNLQTKRKYWLSEFNIKTHGITQKILARLPIYHDLREKSFTFSKQLKTAKNYSRLIGYWQSDKYFSSMRLDLLDEITPKKSVMFPPRISKKLADANTICIHIRRGDYITDPAAINLLGALPIGYYQKAIAIITKKIRLPNFIVVSDDLAWCRQNFKAILPKNTIYYSKGVIEDFWLMVSSNHMIIANSSYSWWAAYLNKYPGKIIIAPKKWFRSGKLSSKDLIPKDWIQV